MTGTDANFNIVNALSRRQEVYRNFSQNFADLKEYLDKYRNSVSSKLDELHISLQRPKVAMNGPPSIGIGAMANVMQGYNVGMMNGISQVRSLQNMMAIPRVPQMQAQQIEEKAVEKMGTQKEADPELDAKPHKEAVEESTEAGSGDQLDRRRRKKRMH